MKIPKSFKLGKDAYRIRLAPVVGTLRGRTHPVMRTIELSTHYRGAPRVAIDIAETFWHETTHCILYDMGHPLWSDEAFVTAFSKRLNQIVHTAILKETNGPA